MRPCEAVYSSEFRLEGGVDTLVRLSVWMGVSSYRHNGLLIREPRQASAHRFIRRIYSGHPVPDLCGKSSTDREGGVEVHGKNAMKTSWSFPRTYEKNDGGYTDHALATLTAFRPSSFSPGRSRTTLPNSRSAVSLPIALSQQPQATDISSR